MTQMNDAESGQQSKKLLFISWCIVASAAYFLWQFVLIARSWIVALDVFLFSLVGLFVIVGLLVLFVFTFQSWQRRFGIGKTVIITALFGLLADLVFKVVSKNIADQRNIALMSSENRPNAVI